MPAGRPRLHLGDHARRLTTDELVPADSAPVSRLGRGRLRRATCGRSSPRVGHPTRRALPRFVGSPSAGSRVPAAGRALGPPHRSRVDRVGFCFGGAQSNLCATNPRPRPRRGDQLLRDARPGSRRLGDSNFPAPLRHAEEIAKPLLALYGGADELIPPQDIESFHATPTASGVPHEIHVYPGAPHSFFDRAYENSPRTRPRLGTGARLPQQAGGPRLGLSGALDAAAAGPAEAAGDGAIWALRKETSALRKDSRPIRVGPNRRSRQSQGPSARPLLGAGWRANEMQASGGDGGSRMQCSVSGTGAVVQREPSPAVDSHTNPLTLKV